MKNEKLVQCYLVVDEKEKICYGVRFCLPSGDYIGLTFSQQGIFLKEKTKSEESGAEIPGK